VGHFTNTKDNSTAFGMDIEEMVLQKLTQFDFPLVFNFPSGHENENLALPLGLPLNLKVNSKSTLLQT
jgi:muramoyltetrapeptide carboxypeptidase